MLTLSMLVFKMSFRLNFVKPRYSVPVFALLDVVIPCDKVSSAWIKVCIHVHCKISVGFYGHAIELEKMDKWRNVNETQFVNIILNVYLIWFYSIYLFFGPKFPWNKKKAKWNVRSQNRETYIKQVLKITSTCLNSF